MVIAYSKGKDQPGKVAKSCSWSIEQGKIISSYPRSRLRNWSREKDSAVPSRASLLISIHRLNLVLTYGIPPEFRGGVVCTDTILLIFDWSTYSTWSTTVAVFSRKI